MHQFLPKSDGILWTAIAGLLGSLIGVIYGIVLLTHSLPADCSESSDASSCYAHPDLGAGFSLIGLSVTLAAIVVLGVYISSLLEAMRIEQLIAAKRARTSA